MENKIEQDNFKKSVIYHHQKIDNYTLFSVISECQKYCFVTERTWNASKQKLAFIGLYPQNSILTYWNSELLAYKEFSQYLDGGIYGGIYMLNLYPLICAKTSDILQYDGEMFDKNISYIRHTLNKSSKVFCAWGDSVFRRAGKLKWHTNMADHFLKSIPLDCLYSFGVLKSGHPSHLISRDGGSDLFFFLESLKRGKKLKDYCYQPNFNL